MNSPVPTGLAPLTFPSTDLMAEACPAPVWLTVNRPGAVAVAVTLNGDEVDPSYDSVTSATGRMTW